MPVTLRAVLLSRADDESAVFRAEVSGSLRRFPQRTRKCEVRVVRRRPFPAVGGGTSLREWNRPRAGEGDGSSFAVDRALREWKAGRRGASMPRRRFAAERALREQGV
nr:MAG: hypothetical protein DIU78_17295 [Pseudomonadota bacterium]